MGPRRCIRTGSRSPSDVAKACYSSYITLSHISKGEDVALE